MAKQRLLGMRACSVARSESLRSWCWCLCGNGLAVIVILKHRKSYHWRLYERIRSMWWANCRACRRDAARLEYGRRKSKRSHERDLTMLYDYEFLLPIE